MAPGTQQRLRVSVQQTDVSNVNKFLNLDSHDTVSPLTPYLVTPLINIACCVVVNTKHRNKPVGPPIGLISKKDHKQMQQKKAFSLKPAEFTLLTPAI